MARTKGKLTAHQVLLKMRKKYKAIKNIKALPLKKQTLCKHYNSPLPKKEPRRLSSISGSSGSLSATPSLEATDSSTNGTTPINLAASTNSIGSIGSMASTSGSRRSQPRYQVAIVERPVTRREARRQLLPADEQPADAPSSGASDTSSPEHVTFLPIPDAHSQMHDMVTDIYSEDLPLNLSVGWLNREI